MGVANQPILDEYSVVAINDSTHRQMKWTKQNKKKIKTLLVCGERNVRDIIIPKWNDPYIPRIPQ